MDPERLAIWGFSTTGGLVLQVAAGNPEVAAVIAQTPVVDGAATTRDALRHTTSGAFARLTARAVADGIGALVGRPPRLVPLAGEPGTVALLSTPDALLSDRALNPDRRYPDWDQRVAARSVLPVGWYRPVRYASRVGCPLLVVVCDADQSASPAAALRVAGRAQRAEVVRLPGNQYAPFMAAHDQAVDAEVGFLRRHLLRANVLPLHE